MAWIDAFTWPTYTIFATRGAGDEAFMVAQGSCYLSLNTAREDINAADLLDRSGVE